MAVIYRWINGPSHTREFEWSISASCTEGVTLAGSCSAFGAGVEFTITSDGTNLSLTVLGTSYTLSSGTGTFSVSVDTSEQTEALFGLGPAPVKVTEMATTGRTATLTMGGHTIDLSSAFTALTGVSPSLAAKAEVLVPGRNGSGSLTITPGTLPFDAEAGTVSRTASGTLSATDPATSTSWSGAWEVVESAGIGASASADYSLTRNSVETDSVPITAFWTSGSTWRYPSALGAGEAYAEAITSADRVGTANALVQSVDAPSSLDWECQLAPTGERFTITGAGSLAFRLRYRRRWIGGYVVTQTSAASDVLTDHKSEHGPLGVKAKLVGQPDTLQQLLPLKLWRWDSTNLAHDATKILDDGSSLTPTGTFAATWSAASGGSVAVVSGAIKLTGSSGKTLTRTTTSSISKWHGYTRMRIRLRCSAASHTIRVGAGPGIWDGGTAPSLKYWDVATGDANTWTNVYIDHSGEHNGLPISRANSVWESSTDPETRGWHFLNIAGTTLVFSNLGAGDYEIDEIELDDGIAYSGATNTPMVHGMLQYVGATGDNARLLVVACAGTQTLDLLGDTRIGTLLEIPSSMLSSGSQWLPGWSSSDLAPRVGGVTVIASTGGGPYAEPDVYEYDTYADRMCSDLWCTYLCGGGLLWDGSWSHTYGDGALVVGDLEAQWSAGTLYWEWPEALDSLPGGDSLGAGIIVGGAVWGRMLKAPDLGTSPHRAPITGFAEATGSGTLATDQDPVDAASGFYSVSSYASEGFFFTGGVNNYAVTALGSSQVPKPSAVVALQTGRRRLVLCEGATSATGSCLSLAQSFTGRLARAWAPTSGTILLETRSQAGGGWSRVDTGVSGSCPALAWDVPSVDGALLMVYQSSGIKLVSSLDEGATWGMATTISSTGSHGVLCVSQSGVRHFFWYDGGAIKRRSYSAQMVQVIAAGSVVASGAADDCPGAVCLMNGDILLTYRTTGGALVSLTSTDGGSTFS